MFTDNNLQNILRELKEILANSYPIHEANSISKLLFEQVGYSNLELITNKSAIISTDQIEFIENSLHRLQNYEPVQYILGRADFYGLQFVVNPSVLIPRQETEELVDMVLKENEMDSPKILDIGTGSGCIALSLKNTLSTSKIDAIDNSEDALKVALKNAGILNLNVHFHHNDILHEAVLPGDYDIIVSNPPYISEIEKSEMHENVLGYEPHEALFVSNASPLIFYECIIELAALHLYRNGKLYFEINENQGSEVRTLLQEAGFHDIRIITDLNNKDRFAFGRWTPKT